MLSHKTQALDQGGWGLQWLPATYVSATSYTLSGPDYTTLYAPGASVQLMQGGSVTLGFVSSSSYAGSTTTVVLRDSGLTNTSLSVRTSSLGGVNNQLGSYLRELEVTGARGVRISSTAPVFVLNETDAATDSGKWKFGVDGGKLTFSLLSDNELASTALFDVTRSGTSLGLWTFYPQVAFPNAGGVVVGSGTTGTSTVFYPNGTMATMTNGAAGTAYTIINSGNLDLSTLVTKGSNGSWSDSTIGAAPGNLNSVSTSGWYKFTGSTANAPESSGTVLVFSSSGNSSTPAGSRLVTQMAFGASNVVYSRSNNNNGGWTAWGTFATSTGAGIFLPLAGGTGSQMAGTIFSTAATALQARNGNYGALLVNDGASFWIGLTNSGDSGGTYNALRPFVVNMSSGLVTLENGLTVSGQATFNNALTAGSTLNVSSTLTGSVGTFSGALTSGSLTTGTVSCGYLSTNGNQINCSNLVASGTVTSNQTFQSATTNVVIAGSGGAVYLRANSAGDGTGQMVLTSTTASFAGSISASNFSGSHSGASSGTNTGDQNLAPYALLSGANFGGAVSAASLTTSGTVTANQNFASSTGAAVLATTGAGSVYLRPNGAGSGTGQLIINSAGAVVASGTIQPGSDIRVKANRVKITGALDKVRSYLVGHEYDRLDGDGEHQAGFLAQWVKSGLPHLVRITPDMNGIQDFHSLDYNGALPYVANGLIELEDKVKAQQVEINSLTDQIEILLSSGSDNKEGVRT